MLRMEARFGNRKKRSNLSPIHADSTILSMNDLKNHIRYIFQLDVNAPLIIKYLDKKDTRIEMMEDGDVIKALFQHALQLVVTFPGEEDEDYDDVVSATRGRGIKVRFGNRIRRSTVSLVHADSTIFNMNDLKNHIQKMFFLDVNAPLFIRYLDEDGNKIEMTHDSDILEAVFQHVLQLVVARRGEED